MGDINKLTTKLSSASMDLVEEEVKRYVDNWGRAGCLPSNVLAFEYAIK